MPAKLFDQRQRENLFAQQGRHQLLKCFFPLTAVRFRFPSMTKMHNKVRHFMNVSEEEQERVTVVVDRNSGRPSFLESKVANLGDPLLAQAKFERMDLPKPLTVINGEGRKMPFEQVAKFGGIHKKQKGFRI